MTSVVLKIDAEDFEPGDRVASNDMLKSLRVPKIFAIKGIKVV